MTEELEQLFDDLKGRYGISDEDMAVVTQAVDTTVAEAVAETDVRITESFNQK